MLWLFIFVLLVYVGIAFIIFFYGERVCFPLGDSTADKVWAWHGLETHKLLLYLQGNAELPLRNTTINFFLVHGYDVLSVGYTGEFESSDERIAKILREHVTKHKYTEIGVVARSIGSTLKIPDCEEITFVIYVTPVSSIEKLAYWHTKSLIHPFKWFVRGRHRGVEELLSKKYRTFMILAEQDTITPISLIDDKRGAFIIPEVGHNDIEVSPRYLAALRQIMHSLMIDDDDDDIKEELSEEKEDGDRRRGKI